MQWASQELRGYGPGVELPDYRQIFAPLYYDAATPAGTFKCWELMTLGLPEAARGRLPEKLPLQASLAELRDIMTSAEQEGESIIVRPAASDDVVNIMNRSGEYNAHIHRIYWRVPPSAPNSIIERVNTEAIERVSKLRAETPQGPGLSSEGLHPWVWNAAASLWLGDNYKQAVNEAAAAVEERTQQKLDRGDLGGTKLYTEAFSLDTKPGNRKLRFPHIVEMTKDGEMTQNWKSAHQGAMHFGQGCSLGIRNLNAHGTGELSEQEALEYLAALSVLARWVDTAEVRLT